MVCSHDPSLNFNTLTIWAKSDDNILLSFSERLHYLSSALRSTHCTSSETWYLTNRCFRVTHSTVSVALTRNTGTQGLSRRPSRRWRWKPVKSWRARLPWERCRRNEIITERTRYGERCRLIFPIPIFTSYEKNLTGFQLCYKQYTALYR